MMNGMEFMGRKIKKAYWGKPGCMCGCNGTYRTATLEDEAEANKRRGYEVKTFSPRGVKNVVKAFDFIGPPECDVGDDQLIWFCEASTEAGSPRSAVIYTNKG